MKGAKQSFSSSHGAGISMKFPPLLFLLKMSHYMLRMKRILEIFLFFCKNFWIVYAVSPYRREVHNDICSDDHETNDKRNDPQVKSFPTQPLGAIIVLLIIALLGLWSEWKVKFNFKIFKLNRGNLPRQQHKSHSSKLHTTQTCVFHGNLFWTFRKRWFTALLWTHIYLPAPAFLVISNSYLYWSQSPPQWKQWITVPSCLILLLTATMMQQQLLLARRLNVSLSPQTAQRLETNLNMLRLSNVSASLNFYVILAGNEC